MVRSEFHLGEFQRVVKSFKPAPINSVGVRRVIASLDVLPVQVAVMTRSEPPAAFELFYARRLIRSLIVITVYRTEVASTVNRRQRISCYYTDTAREQGWKMASKKPRFLGF